MQNLRFVSVEDGWILATNEDGERFRIRADDALRDALRPQAAPRPSGPKVPPRQIQQLIRAGRTVEEVVAATGADEDTIARFEGPIIAERKYIVEQARNVAVRVQQQIDPLATEGLTFGTAIDARLETLTATDIRWDAWKDPEEGWHVGVDFTVADIHRNALWQFDQRGRNLRPLSSAATQLSQQGDVDQLSGPHLRAVGSERTEQVIPPVNHEPPAVPPTNASVMTNETADLLEALRKRRGERQHSVYDEEFEFDNDDQLDGFLRAPQVVRDASGNDPDASERSAQVTPFARPQQGEERDSSSTGSGTNEKKRPGTSSVFQRDQAETASEPKGDSTASSPDSIDAQAQSNDQLDLDPIEPDPTFKPTRNDTGSQPRRRTGRPSMPSWDEIVFGTRSDDE